MLDEFGKGKYGQSRRLAQPLAGDQER
jgi:hypothetical protein